VAATGVVPSTGSPYVLLRLRDSEASRGLLDRAFELLYEVVLGAKQLSLSLLVRNTGEQELSFTAGVLSHVGVTDALEKEVLLLGLQGGLVRDWLEDAEDAEPQPETDVFMRFPGEVDRLVLATQPRLALEVGSGCTVFVENSGGFQDHSVWNPGTTSEYSGNFVCLGSAAAASPIVLPPAGEWEGTSTLFVRDMLVSETMPEALQAQEDAEADARQELEDEKLRASWAARIEQQRAEVRAWLESGSAQEEEGGGEEPDSQQ
jgi:D-hexose-6-phosphate mutarotase